MLTLRFRTAPSALALAGGALAYLPAAPGHTCGDGTNPSTGRKAIQCVEEGSTRIGGSTGGRGGRGGAGGIPELPIDPELNHHVVPIGPPQVSAAVLVQRARDAAELPMPVVHTSPRTRTYVRLRTGLWVIGFQTVSTAPVSAGGQTVRATATPQRQVMWNVGETQITCDGPGRPGSARCGYTFQRSSAHVPGGKYQVTATITWSVHWTCTGAGCDAPEGALDPMPMTSAPVGLTVGEVQNHFRQPFATAGVVPDPRFAADGANLPPIAMPTRNLR